MNWMLYIPNERMRSILLSVDQCVIVEFDLFENTIYEHDDF